MRQRSLRTVSAALALSLIALAGPATADHVSRQDLIDGFFKCNGTIKVGDDVLKDLTIDVINKTEYKGPGGKGKYRWAPAVDKLNMKTGPLAQYRLINDVFALWKMKKDSNGKKVADCLFITGSP